MPTVLAGARYVSFVDISRGSRCLNDAQAMVRRTNVITKLKLTYVKDSYLDVSHASIDRMRARLNRR